MPNPCPNCSKMVSLDFQDPEVNDLELNVEGRKITASVRIVRQCADCGTDMKEATLDVDLEVPKCNHDDGKGLPHVLVDEVEESLSQLEEGGGRYAKSYFGAEGEFKVKCACGQAIAVQWSDKVAASEMEECS